MAVPASPVPPRKRKAHLDAGLLPLEKALLARAAALREEAGPLFMTEAIRKGQRARGGSAVTVDVLGYAMAEVLAAELAAIAEELHFT